MAYMYKQEDEVESGQSPVSGQSAKVDQPQTLSSASGDISGAQRSGIGGGQQPTVATPKPQGSGFKNVTNYLNQNRMQSQGLANKVSGQLQEKGQAANEAISNVDSGFKKQVDQNRVGFDQSLIDQTKQNADQVRKDQAKRSQFTNMLSGQYRGPESLDQSEGYQQARDEARKARESASLVDTEQGRQTLLGNVQRNKSQGVTNFNNLLLQNDPSAQQTLQAEGQKLSGFQGVLDSLNESSRGLSAEAKKQAQETNQKTRDAFLGDQGFINQEMSRLDQEAQALKQSQEQKALAQQQEYLNILKERGFTPEQRDMLGLSQEDLTNIFAQNKKIQDFNFGNIFNPLSGDTINSATDLSKYLKSVGDQSQINRQSVAKEEDFVKQDALMDLLGLSEYYLPKTYKSDLQNDFVDFDLDKYLADTNKLLKEETDKMKKKAKNTRIF